jgi:hypothetical protein
MTMGDDPHAPLTMMTSASASAIAIARDDADEDGC